MSEINELILEKLKKYDTEVIELAMKAIEYAETMPEKTVAEQLENVVRQIIKKKESEK